MKFSVDLERINSNEDSLSEVKKIFLNDGFVIIKNFFTKDFMKQVKNEYYELYSDFLDPSKEMKCSDVGEKRPFLGLEFKGVFSDPNYFANEYLMKFLSEIFGEKIIIGGQGSFIALPGTENQHIHTDSQNMYVVGGEDMVKKGVPYAVTVAFPLVETNELCGGTRFWPGSHLQMDYEGGDSADVFCHPGDAIIFDYRTYHSGIANKSNIARPMLYTVYARYWFRDQVNYTAHPALYMTDDQFQTLSDEHKFLYQWFFNSQINL